MGLECILLKGQNITDIQVHHELNPQTQLPANLALRCGALIAAVAFFLLRKIIAQGSPPYEYLCIGFYCGAYLVLAFLPIKRAAFQIGFSLGYGISMCGGIVFLVLTQSAGFPSGPPTAPWIFKFALAANMGLAALGLGSWIVNRGRINGWNSVRSAVAGAVYPVVAFFLATFLTLPFGR